MLNPHTLPAASGHTTDELVSAALLDLRAQVQENPFAFFIDPTLFDPMGQETIPPPWGQALNAQPQWSALEAALQQVTKQLDAHEAGMRKVPLPWIHHNFAPDHQPYLLCIDSEAACERLVSGLVWLSVAEASGILGEAYGARTVAGWLPLPASHTGRELALMLSRCARIVRPDGHPWYLRFWDPRVLPHLPRALPAGHWDELQNVLAHWRLMDSNGAWAAIASRQEATPNLGMLDERHQRLSSDTWAALQRIGPLNILTRLASQWGVRLDGLTLRHADSTMGRAQHLGFAQERDLVTLGAVALTAHPRIDQHPTVQQALNQAAGQGLSAAQALASFDDEALSAFAAELDNHHEHRPETTSVRT